MFTVIFVTNMADYERNSWLFGRIQGKLYIVKMLNINTLNFLTKKATNLKLTLYTHDFNKKTKLE